MKMNKKRRYTAIMCAIVETVGLAELAGASVEAADGMVELVDTKDSGFRLRVTSGTKMSDSDIKDMLVSAIREICNDNSDEIFDHISDNYDYDVNELDLNKDINEGMIDAMFDIDRDGRIIYIEYDK